ncbi:MAG: MarR family transcriptional regulator [Halioglobus sp.]
MSTSIDFMTITIYYFNMNRKAQQSDTSDNTWSRYQDNFSRHLLGVARHSQTEMMNTLEREHGHQHLRLGFAPYITLLGAGGMRLGDLAQALGISKQACNQACNQIEWAGYISRESDPRDGRAKQLVLTEDGKQLSRHGLLIAARLDEQFADIVSHSAIQDARRTLSKIYTAANLGQISISAGPGVMHLTAGLPALADYVLLRLMAMTSSKGHPGLKLSFGQVLTLIGDSGGKIQHMAAIQDVSKQAISATAKELEALDYISREPDPRDSRQVVLRFTERGRELIHHSVASVDELEQEFIAIAGKRAIAKLKKVLGALYRVLHLEQELSGGSNTVDLSLLAQQLKQQLGAQASQDLGRLLLS